MNQAHLSTQEDNALTQQQAKWIACHILCSAEEEPIDVGCGLYKETQSPKYELSRASETITRADYYMLPRGQKWLLRCSNQQRLSVAAGRVCGQKAASLHATRMDGKLVFNIANILFLDAASFERHAEGGCHRCNHP